MNPVELGGTFPLPEAQVDRFLLKVDLGYLPLDLEVAMLDRFQAMSPLDDLSPVTDPVELGSCQAACSAVYCDAALKHYCVRLVQHTRRHPDVTLGASPRGSLGLLHAAQARAASEDRDFVLPDDIKSLARGVLTHRVILTANAELRGMTSAAIIDEILAAETVPTVSRRLA
jgi:MoxR-like ATPase